MCVFNLLMKNKQIYLLERERERENEWESKLLTIKSLYSNNIIITMTYNSINYQWFRMKFRTINELVKFTGKFFAE